MEKPVVNMSNWQLYVYNDEYNLSGTADQKISNNRIINSNQIKE